MPGGSPLVLGGLLREFGDQKHLAFHGWISEVKVHHRAFLANEFSESSDGGVSLSQLQGSWSRKIGGGGGSDAGVIRGEKLVRGKEEIQMWEEGGAGWPW